MILYDENLNEGLLEFGIQIPVLASRAVKAFEFLKSHDILGPKIDQWHIPKIEEPITKDDLQRVHSRDYVDKLYSPELENEIIRTFELIDENGNYYRYDPDTAKLPLTRLFDRTLAMCAHNDHICVDTLCFLEDVRDRVPVVDFDAGNPFEIFGMVAQFFFGEFLNFSLDLGACLFLMFGLELFQFAFTHHRRDITAKTVVDLGDYV